MKEEFLKPDFKFEKYISERLLEVPDEGQRRALKELIQATMLPVYEHTMEKYRDLEKRLLQSKDSDSQKYEIITGIEERQKVDITEETMVPMNYDDLNEFVVDIEAMHQELSVGHLYTIMKIFIEGNYPLIRKIQQEDRCFHGKVYTENSEYHATVKLVSNQSYLQKFAELYSVFENNAIPWSTVYMPYLNKFFDVQIVSTDCPANQQILQIKVDFEEYMPYVRYDLIPMWNLRRREEKTGAYPDFALDRIHYEHCIFGSHLVKDREYMVAETDIHLWNVFMQEGDIHIVCDEKEGRKWKLLEFVYGAKDRRNEYPVFGNGTANGAGFRLIHTMAEAKKYIQSLGCQELSLVDVQVLEQYQEENIQTYSMDAFLEDELKGANTGMVLKFTFRPADKNSYLNYDRMSYLISRIQWNVPEFRCIGEME